jgi:mannan polymerase II complex ANP1 subunit
MFGNLQRTQMAKRMKFSVVGLPHYTIWHLYEPSVDDIRHMEEMENERKQREAEEKAKQDRMEKIQNDFDDGASQWAKDKEELQELQKSAVAKKADEKKAGDKEAEKPAKKEGEKADEKSDDKAPSDV